MTNIKCHVLLTNQKYYKKIIKGSPLKKNEFWEKFQTAFAPFLSNDINLYDDECSDDESNDL